MKFVAQFIIYHKNAEPLFVGFPVAGDTMTEARRAVAAVTRLNPPPAQIAFTGIVLQEASQK